MDAKGEGFFKPIVTPFEMLVALAPEAVGWSGEWKADFETVSAHLAAAKKHHDKEQNEAQPPTTTELSASVLDRPVSPTLDQIHELAERMPAGELAHYISPAAAFLGAREWKGLETKTGETAVPDVAIEGREGVARGYTHES